MTTQCSFAQIQWLNYVQETDLCVDSSGNRIQIQHAYHRGEVKKDSFKLDGYFVKDGQEYFLEFLGCYFHPGCCVENDKIPDWRKKAELWNRKKSFLESVGNLIVVRECHWAAQLRELNSFDTKIGHILQKDTGKKNKGKKMIRSG